MIKTKYILLCLLCLFVLRASAQSLVAYHVVGKVTYMVNGEIKPLVMSTKVDGNTRVNVPYGGKVEFLDEKNQKRIIIKTQGQGAVSQLIKAKGNSVMELSLKYVAYVKKQLSNSGLVSQKRYSDFATVTREIDSLDTGGQKPQNPFAARFGGFKSKIDQKFQSFRQECNKKYTDFVRQAWAKMGSEPPVIKPVEPNVKPEVYEALNALLDERQEKKATVAENIAPPVDVKQPEPVEPIKRVALSEEEKEICEMPFIFFGSEMTVHLDETKRIQIGDITPDRIADLLLRLSGTAYDNLLYDCLELRKKHNLCDWAYLLMLKEITDQFCGTDTNEAVLMMGYLYCQSGYKIRFASDNAAHLYLLVASDYVMYGKLSYDIDGDKFYPVQEAKPVLHVCQAKFPNESNLSLRISKAMQLDGTEADSRVIKSRAYPDMKMEVAVNRSLIDFYNTYPSAYTNNDKMTYWKVYAETPMNEEVKKQTYPKLRSYLQGLSEHEAVSRLLNFVQTGFDYEYDEVIWGCDRAFFAEETLYYPYCDCEDRSILLTRLVRDLLGLDCVLIYYPGHLACAVRFTEKEKGDYYMFNQEEYTVCDPTYINAPIGMQMPDFKNKEATIIPIKQVHGLYEH